MGPLSTNISINDTDDHFEIPNEVRVLWMIELGVCIAGILGNVLSLVILFHSTQRMLNKTPYLVSLALSDIVTLVAIFGQRLPILTGDHLPGFLGWCNVNFVTVLTGLTMSSLAVAQFTIHRVISLYRPTIKYGFMSLKGAIISLSVLWVLTLALYSPTLFAMKSSHECIAVPGWRWFAVYYRPLLQLIISGIVPDTTILIGNAAIIVKISRVKNQIRDTIAVRASQDEPYNRVIGTCLGLGVFHLVTTLPVMTQLVIWGIRGFYTIEDVYSVLPTSLYLVATFNYAGNFILYMLITQSFRSTLKDIFSCHWNEGALWASISCYDCCYRIYYYLTLNQIYLCIFIWYSGRRVFLCCVIFRHYPWVGYHSFSCETVLIWQRSAY